MTTPSMREKRKWILENLVLRLSVATKDTYEAINQALDELEKVEKEN